MIQTFLKAKLHRARVTHSEPDYEGSCAIDSGLLEISGIQEYEQIHIYNIDNGERFVTYAIMAEKDSGIISVNGAAAHKADPDHKLIICAYAGYSEQSLVHYKPKLVYLNEKNQIVRQASKIPLQVA